MPYPVKPFAILILLAGLASTIACKKNGSNPAPPPGTDKKPSVYLLGTTGDSIVYWKDDTLVLVDTMSTHRPGSLTPQETNLTGIAVAGGHVYVSGWITWNNGQIVYGIPMLWTDGKMTLLPDPSNQGTTGGVFANGSDVYVVGNVGTARGRAAVVWKNGIPSLMPDTGSLNEYVSGIAVSGSDVYVSGGNYSQYLPSSSASYYACYWKNGQIHSLDSGLIEFYPASTLILGYPTTTGLFVSGSDVYISGKKDSAFPSSTPQSYSYKERAMYWKNGTPVLLPVTDQGTEALAIVEANDNVYLAGIVNYIGSYGATMWKNGVLQPIPFPGIKSSANGIAVSGTDVYVAGVEYINGKSYATRWKNNVATHLGTGGAAYKIIVQ